MEIKISPQIMVFRLVVILFFFSISAFSQDNFTKHTVSKGDNIYAIAKQYGVKPKDIIAANPKSPKVLKLNSVLLIPTTNATVAAKQEESPAIIINPTTHEILAKETLWGISKKYKVAVEDLKKANPELESKGLKVGQQINIPSNNSLSEKPLEKIAEKPILKEEIKSNEKLAEKPVEKLDDLKIKVQPESDVEVSREVLPKETKYKIAKEFGITVAELENQNPEIKSKLPVGYILKIKTSKQFAEELQVKTPTTSIKDIQLPNDDAITSAEIEKQNNNEVMKFSITKQITIKSRRTILSTLLI